MAGFDIITPIWGVIENIANGPHHTFVVSEDCGYSGREITNMLHHDGIKTWFHNNSDGFIEFNTKKADAPRAQEVLEKWFRIQTASPEPEDGKQQARGKGAKPYQPGEGWSLFG